MIENTSFLEELLLAYEELYKCVLNVEILLGESLVIQKEKRKILPIFVKNKLINEEQYYYYHQKLLESIEFLFDERLNYEYENTELKEILEIRLPWYIKQINLLEKENNKPQFYFIFFIISNILYDLTKLCVDINKIFTELETYELVNLEDGEKRNLRVTKILEDLNIRLSYESGRDNFLRTKTAKERKKSFSRIFGNVLGENISTVTNTFSLLNEVILGVKEIQGLKADMPKRETGRTAILARFIKKYVVKDESRFGVSSTGKSSGEIDIKIENKLGEVISICEAFNLRRSFSKRVIRKHIEKIAGYNATGLQTIFIIIFFELNNYLIDWERYIEFVTSKEVNIKSYTFVRGQKLPGFDTPKIKIYKTVYNLNHKMVDIFHLFVDMN